MSGGVHVGGAADFPEGEGRRVLAFGRVLGVFRDRGRLFAVDDTCPHEGAPLHRGTVEGGAVVCPLHRWVIDLRSGAARDHPGCGVRTFRVEVVDGEVHLHADAPGG